MVDDLSVSLIEGEALGVVGPNGAGKTSMLNLLTGIIHPDEGKVIFAGQDISRHSPDRRCHAGLARTYQIPKPFEGMTVFENVLVGGTYGRARSEKASYEVCARALDRASLLPRANVLAESLEPSRTQASGTGARSGHRAQGASPRRDRRRPHRAGGALAHRDDQAASRRRHQHHLDRAHRPCAPGRGQPAHGHRLRQADRGGRSPRRSSTVRRCATSTWGA